MDWSYSRTSKSLSSNEIQFQAMHIVMIVLRYTLRHHVSKRVKPSNNANKGYTFGLSVCYLVDYAYFSTSPLSQFVTRNQQQRDQQVIKTIIQSFCSAFNISNSILLQDNSLSRTSIWLSIHCISSSSRARSFISMPL